METTAGKLHLEESRDRPVVAAAGLLNRVIAQRADDMGASLHSIR